MSGENTEKIIGVIGGSGLYEIEGLTDIESVRVDTPFGEPSDEYVVGTLGDARMVFLPRHGRGHRLTPTEINYRANIYGMKRLGVGRIISVSAVGSMREEIEPGHVVVVDQFFDRTTKRASTFFGSGVVGHVAFADPVCPALSAALYDAAASAGAVAHRGGTYICIEGPQFSTRAESLIYRKWGVDVIGMTNMPEAKLAREAEICYATLALSTDYDCWHETEESVSVEMIIETLKKNVITAKKVISLAAPAVAGERDCACAGALEYAILTDKGSITGDVRKKYEALLGRYL